MLTLKIKLVKIMKKQINDLLLKMQTGENCIGETANALLNLFSVSVSMADFSMSLDKRCKSCTKRLSTNERKKRKCEYCGNSC
jgi:hypothetical protein